MKSVRVALAVAATALVLGACGEFDSGILEPSDPSFTGDYPEDAGEVRVFKYGDWQEWPNLVWFCFEASATGGELITWTPAPECPNTEFGLKPGYLRDRRVWQETDPNAATSYVTITELPTPGFQLDSIVYYTKAKDEYFPVRVAVYTGTNTITVPADYDLGAWIKVYNSEKQGGTEGCTPGYWKQTQHFGAWTGYSPGQAFSSVFEDAFPGMTLLGVLEQGGGDLYALGRHTVAALLNAAGSVDYYLSEQAVIDAFNDAYPDGDLEGLKDQFEYNNELGCPLDREEIE